MKLIAPKFNKISLSEKVGYISGFALGIITGAVSIIRQSRTFHPRGLLFKCEVDSTAFPPHALIRFSSAWWKKHEIRDVLGIAIRFMDSPPSQTEVKQTDQDLLFATIKYPWQTPIGPLLTHYHDFFENIYYAVSPFLNQFQEVVKYRLITHSSSTNKGSRDDKLKASVEKEGPIFVLEEKKISDEIKGWKEVATIRVKEEIHLDQEALRFNPFNTGNNIIPLGFVHHLRIGPYFLSQLMRPNSSAHLQD
jgi:hypothetical protein